MSRALRLLREVFLVPVNVIALGADMIALSAQGMQEAADEGLGSLSMGLGRLIGDHESSDTSTHLDTLLSDNKRKLVEYAIVSLERDAERVVSEGQRVITENLAGDAFKDMILDRFARSSRQAARLDRKDLDVFFNVLKRW